MKLNHLLYRRFLNIVNVFSLAMSRIYSFNSRIFSVKFALNWHSCFNFHHFAFTSSNETELRPYFRTFFIYWGWTWEANSSFICMSFWRWNRSIVFQFCYWQINSSDSHKKKMFLLMTLALLYRRDISVRNIYPFLVFL